MKTNKPTSTLVSLARCATILALCSVAFVSLVAEPIDSAPYWFTIFFGSKVVAVASGYALFRLYSRWSKTDKWVRALLESSDKSRNAH